MDKKKIATCLNRNRIKRNLSIEELAEMTDISPDRVICLENGDFSEIKTYELKAISQALNVPIAMLMKGGGLVNRLRRDVEGEIISEWEEY